MALSDHLSASGGHRGGLIAATAAIRISMRWGEASLCVDEPDRATLTYGSL